MASNCRFSLGKRVLLSIIPFFVSASCPGTTLHITPQAGVSLVGWKAEISIHSLSPRVASFMLVPEEVEAVTLTVRVQGFDPGEYDLAVSGSPARRFSSEDLEKGVPVLIPEVPGVIAEPAKQWADEWVGRLDRAQARTADLGYGPEETPQDIQEQVKLIRSLPPELEDAVNAKAVSLCIARSEAGPVAFPPLSHQSLAEMKRKVEAARTASLRLIHLIANLEDAAVQREVFSELLGNWISKPEGEGVEMALAGQAGIAGITIPIQNSFANPPVSLSVRLKPPSGWEPRSELEAFFNLEPGQSKALPFSFVIPQATPGQRVSLPLDLKIKVAGETILQKTGVGFGNDFLRSWKVVGPFPLENALRIDKDFPPETDTGFAESYDNTAGLVSWRETLAESNGYVDLIKAFSGGASCVAYATVWIYLPSSQRLLASVGSDDSFKVSANGKPVYKRSASRAAEPDQDQFSLPLKMGWNRLLIKVTQGTDQWGFFFDISDKTGMTPKGMRISLEPPKR